MEEKTLKPLVIYKVEQITESGKTNFILNDEFLLGGLLRGQINMERVPYINTLNLEFDVVSREKAEAISESLCEKIRTVTSNFSIENPTRDFIETIPTATLVSELARREGVNRIIVHPYKKKEIITEGPATILEIID